MNRVINQDAIDNKSKKNNKKNKIKYFIFGIIVIFIIVYSLKMIIEFSKNSKKTIMIKEGTISKEETDTVLIVRDETIISGENTDNEMEQIVDEGQKVAKGEIIFRYYSDNSKDIENQISDIDKKIQKSMEENKPVGFSADTKLLDTQIQDKLVTLKDINEIQKIKESKKELGNLIAKKAKLIGDMNTSNSELRELINQKEQLEKNLTLYAEYVKSPRSGIVSYRVDGLEDKIKIENLETYNKEYVEKLNLKANQIVPLSEKSGKLINNFECYFVTTSKSKEAQDSKIGDILTITLPNDSKVKGTITNKIAETKDDTTLTIKFSEGIKDLSQYRITNIDITWWDETGYKIPNSCIIHQGNLDYVIRTKGGVNEKVIVKVKKKSDDYSIVSNYSTSELKNIEIDKNVKTTSILYDEILLNPTMEQLKNIT